jgi:hypothetical protein
MIASGSIQARVLAVGDTYNHCVAGHAHDFRASLLQCWDMFQYLCAEHHIETVIWKLQIGYVPLHRPNTRKTKLRHFQVECRHRIKMLCQKSRKVPIPRADV